MATCPTCRRDRDLAVPCPSCGDPAQAAPGAPAEATLSFDDLEPIETHAPPPAGRPRPLPVVEPIEFDLPVIAPLELPVVAPIGDDAAPEDLPVVAPVEDAEPALTVEMETRFEAHSAPADAEPLIHLLLSITPSGAPILDPAAGPIAHVVLALDLSASMNRPDKYPVLTDALSGMLYDLRADSAADVLVSVVVFAYGAETILRAVSAKSIDPRELLASLDRSPLRFGRYTDIVGALNRAGVLASQSLAADRAMPVRVYLLTDGRPQDMDGARAVMAKISKMAVDVDGLAFGSDADVKALQELVSGGRGGTVKQVRADTLSEAFGRIAEVAQRVVANRSLFEVQLAAGVVGGSAFRFRPARHRYGEDAFAGGSRFAADLGSLESERPYSLLFELRLPRGRPGAETSIGTATLRLPGRGGARVFEKRLAIERHAGAEMSSDPEVAAARDVLDALSGDDPQAMLRALKVRRKLYEDERRDPHLIAVLDKAIRELEEHGSLAKLSASEHATLLSHTCTAGGQSAPPKPRGSAAPARPVRAAEAPTEVIQRPPSRGTAQPVRGARPRRR